MLAATRSALSGPHLLHRSAPSRGSAIAGTGRNLSGGHAPAFHGPPLRTLSAGLPTFARLACGRVGRRGDTSCDRGGRAGPRTFVRQPLDVVPRLGGRGILPRDRAGKLTKGQRSARTSKKHP